MTLRFTLLALLLLFSLNHNVLGSSTSLKYKLPAGYEFIEMRGTITSSSPKSNGTLQTSLTNGDNSTGLYRRVYHNGTNGMTRLWLGAKNKFSNHEYQGLEHLTDDGKSVLLNDWMEEDTNKWNCSAFGRSVIGWLRIELGT